MTCACTSYCLSLDVDRAALESTPVAAWLADCSMAGSLAEVKLNCKASIGTTTSDIPRRGFFDRRTFQPFQQTVYVYHTRGIDSITRTQILVDGCPDYRERRSRKYVYRCRKMIIKNLVRKKFIFLSMYQILVVIAKLVPEISEVFNAAFWG